MFLVTTVPSCHLVVNSEWCSTQPRMSGSLSIDSDQRSLEVKLTTGIRVSSLRRTLHLFVHLRVYALLSLRRIGLLVCLLLPIMDNHVAQSYT